MQKKIKRGELSETFAVKALPFLADGLPMLINRRSKSLYISLFLLFLLNNCAKEAEFHERNYPFLVTKEVSEITDTSVVFNAEIISTGKESVIEYGFIWDTFEPDIESSYRITMDKPATTGKFSAKVDFYLNKDKEQFVRVYMITNKYKVFSNTVSFTSKGGLPPEIHEINPEKGYENSQFVIKGNNFGFTREIINVYFGEVKLQVDSCNNNNIYARLPDISHDQEEKIRVSIYGKEAESDIKFRAFTYWDRIAYFPGERRFATVAFSINNIGYVGLGRHSTTQYFNDFYAYDPQANNWSRIADFPGDPRAYAAAGVIDNKAYVGFGNSPGIFHNDLWQYDPDTDSWTKILDDPLVTTFGDAQFVLSDALYIVTFHFTIKYLPATNQIIQIEKFPGGYRNFVPGLSNDGKGYLIAGSLTNYGYNKDLWSYDPILNKWTRKADLPAGPRDGMAFFAVNNRIFAGLGKVLQTNPLEFFEYHPSNDTWTYIGLFKSNQRRLPAFFTIGDKAYVGLGTISTNNQLNDFWQFNPVKE